MKFMKIQGFFVIYEYWHVIQHGFLSVDVLINMKNFQYRSEYTAKLRFHYIHGYNLFTSLFYKTLHSNDKFWEELYRVLYCMIAWKKAR